MNRLYVLTCTYYRIIKEKAPIVLLGFFFGFITLFFLLLFDYEFSKNVISMKDTYGEYAFRIDTCDDVLIEKVSSLPGIVNTQKMYVEEFSEKNHYCSLYNLDESKLDYLGFEIVEGCFPKHGQILVCREFSLNHSDLRIGNTITINKNQYEISGIFNTYSPFIIDDSGEYSFITCIDKGKKNIFNCAYFSINQWYKYTQILDSVSDIVSEDIYPNLGMYFELQLDQSLSLYEQYKVICSFFFALVIFCSIVINYNYLKYLHKAHINAVSILSVIGIKKKDNLLAFSITYMFLFFIGIIGSVLLLLLSVFGMTTIYPNYRSLIFSNYMYNLLLHGIVIFIIATTVSLFILFISTNITSPADFLKVSLSEIDHRKAISRKGTLFQYKGRHVFLKLGLNNIYVGLVHSIISIIGFALAISLITTGMYYSYFFKNNHDNHHFTIKIKMYDFFDANNNMDVTRNLYKDNFHLPSNVKTIPLFEYTVTAEYDLRLFSNDYKSYLSQNMLMDLSLSKNKDGTVSLPTIILGYSESELNQLKTLNPEINNTNTEATTCNAFLVSSIYSDNNNTKTITIAPRLKKEEKIRINYYQDKMSEIYLIGAVDEIPIYPEMSDYTPIIIISEKDFFKLLGIDIPKDIYMYVKDNSTYQQVKEIITNLENKGLIQESIDINAQNTYSQKEGVVTRSLLVTIYSTIIILFALLIWVNIILEYKYNQNYYTALKIIGFKQTDIIKIFNYQVIIIAGASILISVFFSFVITKYLLLLHEPLYGDFLYEYPIKRWGLSVISTVIIIRIIQVSIVRYINGSLKKDSTN